MPPLPDFADHTRLDAPTKLSLAGAPTEQDAFKEGSSNYKKVFSFASLKASLYPSKPLFPLLG